MTKLPAIVNDFENLLAKARRGEKESLEKMREVFDGLPDLWESYGDIALEARGSLIRVAAGQDKLAAEAFHRKVEMLQAEVAGPSPSPLENLLAERVALCWLHLYYAESYFAPRMQSMTMPQVEFYERRITACHKRYLSAINSLATVRRLERPAMLQLNVAQQQINVAGDAP